MRYCDGIFLLGDLHESHQDRSFLAQMGSEYPLVQLCRDGQQLVLDTPSVDIDNRKGACMALEYLVSLGHEQIAFIGAGCLGDLNERYETYCGFMVEHFGNNCTQQFTSNDNNLAGGYEEMSKLLIIPLPPTAVFAVDDTMAVGALKACADLAVQVPRDISVIGFDDIKITPYLVPALTTIKQPVDQIAHQAIEMMLSLLPGRDVSQPSPHILIEPNLVVRSSCAKLPA